MTELWQKISKIIDTHQYLFIYKWVFLINTSLKNIWKFMRNKDVHKKGARVSNSLSMTIIIIISSIKSCLDKPN